MSPQKRVTRARAAANKAGDVAKTSKTNAAPKSSIRKKVEAIEENPEESDMPIINEPLRKSARRVATAAPSRRLRITPLNSTTDIQESPQEETNPSQILSKPRATRSRKAAADEASLEKRETDNETAKPRRQARGAAKAKDTTIATTTTSTTNGPRLRGRPRRADVVHDEVMLESEKTKKQGRTRTRSASASTAALVPAQSTTSVPKKKVTFEEALNCDKENQPVSQAKGAGKAKAGPPARGLKAKPVRRPATAARGTTKQSTAAVMTETAAQRILTPKKVLQVAKSSSPVDSDEDELNGAKTPMRDLSQSPRRNINIARTVSPIKKLDFGAVSLASSPVKSQATSTLFSPARRPASSPSKDAFKESPKRVGPSLRMPDFSTSNEEDKTRDPAASSTILLQSPKRVAFEPSMFLHSTVKTGKSPFKASLLKSPPKRPMSPVKGSSWSKLAEGRATPCKEFDVNTMSPDVTVPTNSEALQSAKMSSLVHTASPKESVEEARCAIDFDESIVDIRSPLKLESQVLNATSDVQDYSQDNLAVRCDSNGDALMSQVEAVSDIQDEEAVLAVAGSAIQLGEVDGSAGIAPESSMLRDQGRINAASFLFRASGLNEDDESSEDELQSPVRMFQAQTPVTGLANESRFSMAGRAVVEQNPGFTPLATQLSGWLASSPDKPPIKRSRPRGIFSPAAAEHVRGEVVIDRRSPATSRVSLEPRLSALGRQSVGGKKRFGQRSSLAVSMGGTPDRSSHFADEMAVKDLEEAIESMQAEDQHCDLLHDTNSAEAADATLIENDAPLHAVEETGLVSSTQEDESAYSHGQTMETEFEIAPGEGSRNFLAALDPDTTLEVENEGEPLPGTSQDSSEASAYGDGNDNDVAGTLAKTNNSAIVKASSNRTALNKFTTPLRPQAKLPRFANTVVSKVPLRPEGHISPIKLPKKRSRSLSGGPSSSSSSSSIKKTPPPLSSASKIPRSTTTVNRLTTPTPPCQVSITPSSTTTTPGQQSFAIDDFGDSTLDGIEVDDDDENLPPTTPTSTTTLATNSRSCATAASVTPSKTPKQPPPPPPPPPHHPAASAASAAPCGGGGGGGGGSNNVGGVLSGAVIFVDVHTTEGADASGIFIELLAQMGARCVRNWAWNPRAAVAMGGIGDDGDAAAAAGAAGGGRIGITHVVYKDGGKRTLEKVRDCGGVVKCVGVGWVLE